MSTTVLPFITDSWPYPWPPMQNNHDFVRVRHYSQVIDAIKSSMVLQDKNEFGIWVEYPITTSYKTLDIQKTSIAFYRPLNGKGGFVEFNVDRNRWDIIDDPNLNISNSKLILLLASPFRSVGFRLDAKDVDAQFFDWRGQRLR